MNMLTAKSVFIATIFSVVFGATPSAQACTRLFPFKLSEIFEADVIVRATAQAYVKEPDPNTMTTGVPEPTIKFEVEEVLLGQGFPATIILPGYLSDLDDFNDVPLPYRFVRPEGRHGSCFANNYRKGAQFLLFLRKHYLGYTPYWGALAPVNEQLRSARDPWVGWVKAYLSPCVGSGAGQADYGEVPKRRMDGQEGRVMAAGADLEKYRYAKCYLTRFGRGGERAERLAKVVDGYETVPQAE